MGLELSWCGRCSPCSVTLKDRLCELWRRIKLEFTIEVPAAQTASWSGQQRPCCCLPVYCFHGCQDANSGRAGRASRVCHPTRRHPPLTPTAPLAHPLLQLPLLIARWKQVLFGALFQYVHGIFTQLAHRMHQPQEEPLGDLGFRLMPVRLLTDPARRGAASAAAAIREPAACCSRRAGEAGEGTAGDTDSGVLQAPSALPPVDPAGAGPGECVGE